MNPGGPVSGAASPRITYVICTNPRSGSYLLCDGLASTRLAGRPREWFNPLGEESRRTRWGLDKSTGDYAAYLEQVRVRSTTRNGISGIKLHFYQFAELSKRLASTHGFQGLATSDLMSKAFPHIRYLWLTRHDKARQAISYLVARKTRDWWVIDGTSSSKGEAKIAEVDFDPEAVARMEEIFIQNDAAWHSYFNRNHISPLIVHYENLVADYGGVIVQILEWLDVPNADVVTICPSRLKRQSTALNEDWLARYSKFKTQRGPTPGRITTEYARLRGKVLRGSIRSRFAGDMKMYGLAGTQDDWSQLHYKVRVRPAAPPLPTQCLWGSAGLTQNMTFSPSLILHIRNDLFGEPVTIGTQVVSNAPGGPPAQTIIGTLQPGECVSIPIQACSGVFATCPVESTVYCLIKASA